MWRYFRKNNTIRKNIDLIKNGCVACTCGHPNLFEESVTNWVLDVRRGIIETTKKQPRIENDLSSKYTSLAYGHFSH